MPTAELEPFDPRGDYFETLGALDVTFREHAEQAYEPTPGVRVLAGSLAGTSRLSHVTKELGEPHTVHVTLIETHDRDKGVVYRHNFSVIGEDGVRLGPADTGFYHHAPTPADWKDNSEMRGRRHRELISDANYLLMEAQFSAWDLVDSPEHDAVAAQAAKAEAAAKKAAAASPLAKALLRATRRERRGRWIANFGRWFGPLASYVETDEGSTEPSAENPGNAAPKPENPSAEGAPHPEDPENPGEATV